MAEPQPNTTSAKVPPAEVYAALLDEARAIKGVSLWQDAWRRLRRNRAAMASGCFLIAIALLALLTPILPLQSPIAVNLKTRQFLPPDPYKVTLGLKEYYEQMDALEAELAAAAPADAPTVEEKIKALKDRHPREVNWHDPGPLTRAMIDARIALFGDYCIPSICGADNLGRDILSRICWGARVSLVVGIVATLVSLVIGVTYGAIAGYVGGWLDSLMMRLVDVLYSVPFIFIVIFLITILSEESVKRKLDEDYHIDQITIFYIVIGAIYWLTMARVVRGQVISLKNEQFIDAAKTIGASRGRIVFRHLIPNVMGIVIVYLTLTIPSVMLFEAFLSFLGLGVQAPDVSWGLLASEGIEVITPVRIYWWLIVFPGATLALTLFALNFLGDGLRDALDPRMKNRA